MYDNNAIEGDYSFGDMRELVNGKSYPALTSKMKPWYFNAAGKNFVSFDQKFLERLPRWKQVFKIRGRVLDPAILFVDWTNDTAAPGLSLCKERAGLPSLVTHNAVEDAMGQWKHPGRCTMIPSNRITMQNVPHKVIGIDDTGHVQIMHPEQQYEYPGSKVFEIPLTAQQKTLAIQLMNRMKNGKPF
jgi:hypothetical protein